MRSIIHLDMDAFYASVEQHDRPELQGRPVIVGGSRERGVVCACSYETRPSGVRSAMPMAEAMRRCPRATVLPVRMDRYREVSREIFAIYDRFTDLVEPLSIDEAFLDVTASRRLLGTAGEIAARIRSEVRQGTGLAVSAGVAPNKFLAKMASEHAKPDGLLEIMRPEEIEAFLEPLPVGSLWGVGKVTAQRLENQGLKTVADLRRSGRTRLQRLLGTAGDQIHRLACGIDERPVIVREPRKSIGHEDTYARDLYTLDRVRAELLDLADRVARRLRRNGVAGTCLTLKVRYADFVTVTRSRTLPKALDHAADIHREALDLLQKTEAGRRPVRLLGLSLSELVTGTPCQGELFEDPDRSRRTRLDRAMDALRDRFGDDLIGPGSLLDRDPPRSD